MLTRLWLIKFSIENAFLRVGDVHKLWQSRRRQGSAAIESQSERYVITENLRSSFNREVDFFRARIRQENK